jgi:hypothetical protein
MTKLISRIKAAKPTPKQKALTDSTSFRAKPLGIRAQSDADAASGNMPPKLAFTHAGNARYQKKVDALNAAAARGDVKALNAVEIEPYSSSPKRMIRWRDLAIIAIRAKAKAAKAK